MIKKITIVNQTYHVLDILQLVIGALTTIVFVGLIFLLKSTEKLYLIIIIFLSLIVIFSTLLLIKFFILYKKNLPLVSLNAHLCVHTCRNTFFELQRILHDELSSGKATIDTEENEMRQITEDAIRICLDCLSTSLTNLSGSDVFSLITIFDVPTKIEKNSSIILELNPTLRILWMCPKMPEYLRSKQGMRFQLLDLPEYHLLLKNELEYLYISSMALFHNKCATVCNEDVEKITMNIDKDLLKAMGSKIIVPIRRPNSLDLRTPYNILSSHVKGSTKWDWIGFLVAFTKKAGAFKPSDEEMYINQISIYTDSLFPVLERLRTYNWKPNSFSRFLEAHRVARLSDVFIK